MPHNRPMNADPHQQCGAPPARAGYRQRWASQSMRLVGSITKVLLSVFLGFYLPVRSVTAALSSQEKAELLSSAYVEATFDDGQMVYQLALSKLQAIQLFDAEMTKMTPAPALNPAHPIWKAARN